MKNGRLLCTAEAAKVLGYTLQHTRLLIRQGRLDAAKVSRDWVIEERSLAVFAAQRPRKAVAG